MQDRNGFLAKRAVVVDEGDMLALEFVGTTQFFGDFLNDDVPSHPIGASRSGSSI